MKKKVKVAVIQMKSVPYDKDLNRQSAEAMINKAGSEGCKIIALPELFTTGYHVSAKDLELAETVPGPSTDWLEGLGSRFGCYIGGAILERSPVTGVVYDTFVLAGPDGLVGAYRKVFLWQDEALRFAHGTNYPVFDLGFTRVGTQICYEAGFPEGARLLTLQGAEILIYSAAFAKPRSYAWELATRARALENGAFVLAANAWGQEGDAVPFAGHSRIIAPDGTVLTEEEAGESVLIQEIDLTMVEQQRVTIPYLRDYNIPLMKEKYAMLAAK
jgi:predicted amidohydrolase